MTTTRKLYMTSKRSSDISYWVECKSTTLIGAKREATAEYGSGYIDAVLMIAEGDNVTEQRREIAYKANMPGAKWVNRD